MSKDKAEEIISKIDKLYLQIKTEARDFESALLRRTERLNAEVDQIVREFNKLN
jgi:hypothetical protein